METVIETDNHRKIKNFKDSELVFCSFSPVGLDDYIKYFINNFKNTTYLKWKFPHSKGVSEITKYKDSEVVSKKTLFSLPVFNNKILYFLFLPLNYFIYFLQSLMVINKGTGYRILFGINYFCTLCGIILRKFGKVDFVIYRVMDFFPLPPSGPYRILNRVFYKIDKFCLDNADSIWFTTEGHIEGREKYKYFDRSKHSFKIIPLGLDTSKYVSRQVEDGKLPLVYCGVVSKYHLIDLLFDVIADLKNEFKNVKLNLIGSGPDENYFKDLSKKMGLEDCVIFHGFVEEGDRFRDLMSNNLLGIAFYRDEENFMKYTEPAKVKYYLSFGVPAIVSDVPKIARELDFKRVSFAVNNDKQEIVSVIKRYFLDKDLQMEYKENVGEFVQLVDINNLLERAFRDTFGARNYE